MNQGLDPALQAHIRSLAATAPTRVFAISQNSRKLWVKTAGIPRRRSSILLQWMLATLFGLPMLRPPRRRSGAAALAAEAAAIRNLAADGFPVPEVIGCTPEWLVLGDAGTALESDLGRLADVDERWRRIKAAAALLSRLHAAGLWHGGAQIRNFSWRDGRPGLLDFEDHDLPGMTRAERQARDLLLFLYSLTRYEPAGGPPRLPRLATAMLSEAAPDARAALAKFLRRTNWIIALARLIQSRAGRDVRQAVAAEDAIAAALRATA